MPNASTLTLSIRINADGTAAVTGLDNVDKAAGRTNRSLTAMPAAINPVMAAFAPLPARERWWRTS